MSMRLVAFLLVFPGLSHAAQLPELPAAEIPKSQLNLIKYPDKKYPKGFVDIVKLGNSLMGKSPVFGRELGHIWSLLESFTQSKKQKIKFKEMSIGVRAMKPGEYDQKARELTLNPQLFAYPTIMGLEVLIHELQHAYEVEVENRTRPYLVEPECRAMKAQAIALAIYGKDRYVEDMQDALLNRDYFQFHEELMGSFQIGDQALCRWVREKYAKATSIEAPGLIDIDTAYLESLNLQKTSEKDIEAAIKDSAQRLATYMESTDGFPHPVIFKTLQKYQSLQERRIDLKKDFNMLRREYMQNRPYDLVTME